MPRPFIPAPNCASVELIYNYVSDYMENTLKVTKGSPYSFADLQAVRTIFDNWDNATWKNQRTLGMTLFRIRTRALDTAGSPMEDYYLPAPRAGSISGGQAWPPAICVAIKANTNRQGRSFRGRIYHPILNSLQAANQQSISVAQGTALVTGLTTLMTNLAAAGHTLVVVSYSANKAYRAVALATPVANWTIVDYNLDIQRRRMLGRGHGI